MPPPGHLAAVGLNEAGGARGGHRLSPAPHLPAADTAVGYKQLLESNAADGT